MRLKHPLAALLVAALALPVTTPPAFAQNRANMQRGGGGGANKARLPGKPQASARQSINSPKYNGGNNFNGGHNNANRPNKGNRPNRGGGNNVVAGNNVVVARPPAGGYYNNGRYYGPPNNGWYDDDDNDFLEFVGKTAAVTAGVAAVTAVIGSVVNKKPDDCQEQMSGGQVYLYCNGAWYQPVAAGGQTQYQVVAPPAGG